MGAQMVSSLIGEAMLGAGLTLDERAVISLRYGLYGGEGNSQEWIGAILRISVDSVNRLEAQGLRKLRRWNDT